MLNFPLRLTANLARCRFASRANPIQFLDAAEVLHSDSPQPISHEKVRHLISSKSPLIWIGGSDPLLHPGVSHLVRALTHTGHFVFLETEGTLLRRRIHEFQPVLGLFLTVRLNPADSYAAAQTLHPTATQLALEGIRAAQLSGFLVAIHARIQPHSDLDTVARLFQHARSINADGIIATSPADCSHTQKVSARKLIANFWWQSFSELVDPLLSSAPAAEKEISSSAAILPLEDHSSHEEEVHLA